MLLVSARKILPHAALFYALIELLLLNYMLLACTGDAEKPVSFLKCWQWQPQVSASSGESWAVGHWELKTRNSRLFRPLLSFYFMGTIIFATVCFPFVWLLVNLRAKSQAHLQRLNGALWYSLCAITLSLCLSPAMISFPFAAISAPSFSKCTPLCICMQIDKLPRITF